MKKLKVNDLFGVVSGDTKVLIYSAYQSTDPDSGYYDDLYDGFYKSIPNSLLKYKIHVMFPIIRKNENYLYIQIIR